jgi:hypothetical protein
MKPEVHWRKLKACYPDLVRAELCLGVRLEEGRLAGCLAYGLVSSVAGAEEALRDFLQGWDWFDFDPTSIGEEYDTCWAHECSVLGIDPSLLDSAQDLGNLLRKARNRQARLYHQDKGGSHQRMCEINDAYEMLSTHHG